MNSPRYSCGIMVYCQVNSSGMLLNSSREMLFIGHQLSQCAGEPLISVIIGNNLTPGLEQMKYLPVDKVLYCEDTHLSHYSAPTYANVLSSMILDVVPRVVLTDASFQGRDLAARTAAKLHTGLTADCTKLAIQDGLLLQTRPAFHGNVEATIVCEHACPQMATVRPGLYPPLLQGRIGNPEFISYPVVVNSNIKCLKSSFIQQDNQLTCADIIVAGGKGLRNIQGAEQLIRFARVLGAPVGATRAAVEAGWFPYSMQIGQTGKTVHAKLYIACGISGSAHHFAGVQANRILAINHDRNAPIFKRADYGICGDLRDILPAIEAALKKQD